jgi:hypothetical protein
MAVRVLLVLSAFTVLYGCYGCGQASTPVEKQERKEGVEQAAEGVEKQPSPPPHPKPQPNER